MFMKIVIVDSVFKTAAIKNVNAIPQIAAQVDMGYVPVRRVADVIMYPGKRFLDRLEPLLDERLDIEAVVVLE